MPRQTKTWKKVIKPAIVYLADDGTPALYTTSKGNKFITLGCRTETFQRIPGLKNLTVKARHQYPQRLPVRLTVRPAEGKERGVYMKRIGSYVYAYSRKDGNFHLRYYHYRDWLNITGIALEPHQMSPKFVIELKEATSRQVREKRKYAVPRSIAA